MIDIKQEYYFPGMFRLFGLILIFSALPLYIALTHNLWMYLLLIILPLCGVLMITTRYGLLINPSAKTYTVYTWVLGKKSGKVVKFQIIERFYINEVKDTTLMTTGAGITHDIKQTLFKTYMKLDSEEKVHVDTDVDFDKLAVRTQRYMAICKDCLQINTLSY